MTNTTSSSPRANRSRPAFSHWRCAGRAWVYLRIAAVTEAASRLVGLLQRGRISIYLLYSFVTLVTLLLLTQA